MASIFCPRTGSTFPGFYCIGEFEHCVKDAHIYAKRVLVHAGFSPLEKHYQVEIDLHLTYVR